MTIEQFEAMTCEQRESELLPADSAVLHLPAITLDADSTFYLQQGQAVWQSGVVPAGLIRLYNEAQIFLGLGEQQSDGKVAPKRLIVNKE